MSGMSFEEWKGKVESVLSRRGIRIDEIPEADLQQAFGDGQTPIVFANQFERVTGDPTALPILNVRTIKTSITLLRVIAVLLVIISFGSAVSTFFAGLKMQAGTTNRFELLMVAMGTTMHSFLIAVGYSAILYALSILIQLAWKATGGKSIQ